MTLTRSLPKFGFLLALFGAILAGDALAQCQKNDYPYQKGPEREQAREPEQAPEKEQVQQGGYQAPPPTGALQGPMRELGISGGEIEFPALRLRLPRLRLPCLSVFMTPPQMQMEPGVAPLTQQVQEQVSVPAGKTEQVREPAREPDRERASEAFQKGDLSDCDCNPTPGADLTEVARIRNEMVQFETRMDQKLAVVSRSIEVLAAERGSEDRHPLRDTRVPDLTPLPDTEESLGSHVRPSSYLFEGPLTKVVDSDAPQPRRLPVPGTSQLDCRPAIDNHAARPQRLPPVSR